MGLDFAMINILNDIKKIKRYVRIVNHDVVVVKVVARRIVGLGLVRIYL